MLPMFPHQRPVSASRRHTSPVGARYAASNSTPSAPVVSVGRLGGGYPTSSTTRPAATIGSSVRGSGKAAPTSTSSSRRSVPASPQRLPSVSRLSSVSSTSYVSSHISLLNPTPARGVRASTGESPLRNLAAASPGGASPAGKRFSSPAPQPKVSALRAFSSSPKRSGTISQLVSVGGASVRGGGGISLANTININSSSHANNSVGNSLLCSPAVAALKQHYAAYLKETDDIFHNNPSQKEVISRLHAKVAQLTEALEGMQTVDLVNHQLRLDIGRLEHENKTLREAVQILTRRQKEEEDNKVKDATVICELKRSLAGAVQKDQIAKAASTTTTNDSKIGGMGSIVGNIQSSSEKETAAAVKANGMRTGAQPSTSIRSTQRTDIFLNQGEDTQGEMSTVASLSAATIGLGGSSPPSPRMSSTTANLMKALSAMSGRAKAELKTYENSTEKASLHADHTQTPRARSSNPVARRAGSAPPPPLPSTSLSPAMHQQQTQTTRRSATPTSARPSAAAKGPRTPPPLTIIKKREGSQTPDESHRFQSPTISSKLKDAVTGATAVHSPLPAQTSSAPNGHRQRFSSSSSASPTRRHTGTPPRADHHHDRGGHAASSHPPSSESREPTLSGDSLPHYLPAAYHQPYHNLNNVSEGGHQQHKDDYDERIKSSGKNNKNNVEHAGLGGKVVNNASARANSSEARRRDKRKEVSEGRSSSSKGASGKYNSGDGGGLSVEGVVAGRPIGLPPSALTEGYLRAKFKSYPNSAAPSVHSMTPLRSAASSRTPSSAAVAAFVDGTPVVVRGYSPPLLMHPQPSHTNQWAVHVKPPTLVTTKELFPREGDEEKVQQKEGDIREKGRRLSSGGVLNLQTTMRTTSPQRTPVRMELAHLSPAASDVQLTRAVNSHHYYANDGHGTAGTSFASSEGAASRRRGSLLNITPVEPLSVGETEERYRKTVLGTEDNTSGYDRRNEMTSTAKRTGRAASNTSENTNKSGNNNQRGGGEESAAHESSVEGQVTNSIFADPESAVALFAYSSSSQKKTLLRHQNQYLKVANTIINNNDKAKEEEEEEKRGGNNNLGSNGTEQRIGVAARGGGGGGERVAAMNNTPSMGEERTWMVGSGGVSVGGGIVTLKVREPSKESEAGRRQAAATIGSRDLLVPPPPSKVGGLAMTSSPPHRGGERQHDANNTREQEVAGNVADQLHSLSSSTQAAARIQLGGGSAARATTTTIEKTHTTTRIKNRSPNRNTTERRVDRSLSSSSVRTTQSLPSAIDHFSRLAIVADGAGSERSLASTGDERTMIAALSSTGNRNNQRATTTTTTSTSTAQREEHHRRQHQDHQLRTQHYLQQVPPAGREKENKLLPRGVGYNVGGTGRGGELASLVAERSREGATSSSVLSVVSSSGVVEVSALTAAEEERTAQRRVEEEDNGEGSLSNPSASLLSSRTARFEESSSDALYNNNNRDRRRSNHSYSAHSNGEEDDAEDGRWSAVATAHEEGSRKQNYNHHQQSLRFRQGEEDCDNDDGEEENDEEGDDYGEENDEEFVMFY